MEASEDQAQSDRQLAEMDAEVIGWRALDVPIPNAGPRRARLQVYTAVFEQMFRDQEVMKYRVVDGLPADAKIMDVTFDYGRSLVTFWVDSASFAPIVEGSLPPLLNRMNAVLP